MGHDLDNQELRATRKLLGLDKKEGIEEDIKILNGIDIKFLLSANIEQSNFIIDEANKINKAIYHLLQDYTRQKQRNKEHQKINGELREKVKELEIDLTTVYIKGVEDGKDKYKQKIKNKIEDLNLCGDSNGRDTTENLTKELAIEILQELL